MPAPLPRTAERPVTAADVARSPWPSVGTVPDAGRWHRDHPVLVPLTGFFTGLALTLLVPGAFAALLESVLPQHTVADVFPLVLVTLAVPLVLAVPRTTRRFGLYLALGIVVTAVVVAAVSVGVVWAMAAAA